MTLPSGPRLPPLPAFDRAAFRAGAPFLQIGEGSIGGKAAGLWGIQQLLAERAAASAFPGFLVAIPQMVVLGTGLFETFVARNRLEGLACGEEDERTVAHHFQKADLPIEIVGDLRVLCEQAKLPLAVRSSSLLEDALQHPFAGVYATKMIPNNQPDADSRFRKLVEAIKFVWASSCFPNARQYLKATGHPPGTERMAVVIQEVVGRRHRDRFYPDLSGVGRTFNYYPVGKARPEDGVVNLALGLGKTIVDGGRSWTFAPAFPTAAPPFTSAAALLKETQLSFWGINLGRPPVFDPLAETEYLFEASLAEAEEDGVLDPLVSTYDGAGDRLYPGTGRSGPRALTFAPLLVYKTHPLNETLKAVLAACREGAGADVEIEFAATFPGGGGEPRLGFLQVRPMAVSSSAVEVSLEDLASPLAVVASPMVMGNGEEEGLRDIVFVRRETFEGRHTPAIARDLAQINRALTADNRPYLLIGFGRWGSSDPWLGIPVEWSQISGARVIVEAMLPAMNVELSQGSHFFHNLTGFGVCYLSVPFSGEGRIDWEWLESLTPAAQTDFVRHVSLPAPLRIKVDGRGRRGVALRPR